MKDKIGRLAKGITDIETPVIQTIPESFSDTITSDWDNSVIIELLSTNGIGMKGICFADDPRLRPELRTFVGRRVHVSVRIDTAGLREGAVLEGNLAFVTNGGEFCVPYRFEYRRGAAADDADRTATGEVLSGPYGEGLSDNPLRQEPAGVSTPKPGDPAQTSPGTPAFLSRSSADPAEATHTLSQLLTQTSQGELLCDSLPEDEPLFYALLAALIRADESSYFAFCVYREAIRRGISITRLYESYVHAYPAGLDEAMPKEVLLYFSFGIDSDRTIQKKIYKNILLHTERSSELYGKYEAKISHYAVSAALDGRIDDDLAVLYDRILCPAMIDGRAAAVLPDIFLSRKLTLVKGSADWLIVSYPEQRGGIRAHLGGNTVYVPVYSDRAKLTFFGGEDGMTDVSGAVEYRMEAVFDRPDILKRCFELDPGHPMLLLSQVREITRRGIADDGEQQMLVRALKELALSRDFRYSVISGLIAYCGGTVGTDAPADASGDRSGNRAAGKAAGSSTDRLPAGVVRGGADLGWLSLLREEDYRSDLGTALFGLLVKNGYLPEAYRLLRLKGMERVAPDDAAALAAAIIDRGTLPAENGQVSPYFIGLCRYLYDRGRADGSILRLLTHEYEGLSEEMFGILQTALAQGTELYDLPEKILTVKLFAGTGAHLDETFDCYLRHCDYTETLLRAYLSVRCSESFLGDEETDDGILYETLNGYARAVDDPLSMPLIYQLELTRRYADREALDEGELALCQKLTDALVARGLVFCYTKKLRKKIRVSEDIIRRFYVEYRASGENPPKMLSRVQPDEEEYHVTDMRRVYKNIYVMSTILFKGDELQYMIYDSSYESEPSAEGMISVKKFHRQNDKLFEDLNAMTKALEDGDLAQLKENMLDYAEQAGTIRTLFSLEK